MFTACSRGTARASRHAFMTWPRSRSSCRLRAINDSIMRLGSSVLRAAQARCLPTHRLGHRCHRESALLQRIALGRRPTGSPFFHSRIQLVDAHHLWKPRSEGSCASMSPRESLGGLAPSIGSAATPFHARGSPPRLPASEFGRVHADGSLMQPPTPSKPGTSRCCSDTGTKHLMTRSLRAGVCRLPPAASRYSSP